MRILTIHADYIEVEARSKALKDAELISEEKKKERYEELLIVFTSIEKGDENVEVTSQKLCDEAIKVADMVKTKKILLYPFVHLTSKPSAPKVALEVLLEAEKKLKAKNFIADHSPFGWYKAFSVKSKGHPLSELSREISNSSENNVASKTTSNPSTVSTSISTSSISSTPTTVTIPTAAELETLSKSLAAESQLKSHFYILDSNGKLHEVDKFDYSKHSGLKNLATYETKKVRSYEKEPPHIKIMKEHSLIDYEPGSDSGNFRLLPKGRLMKKILERMITDWCVDYGALEVESPIMYDFEHPSLKKYLSRFPARQYVVISDEKRFFLRFAACFGQFLIAHDMVFSHKQLPLKLFELTRYSFRREQSGELAGLKRLRAFTMPDMHTFILDTKMAKEEFERQYDISLKWNTLMNVETEIAFRVQEDFFNEHKDWYLHLVKKAGKPILIELFKERYAYFITKFEFNFIDSALKASTLSTVQIDVENADTYDINYVDASGQKKRPLILHASISGSLERVIYALLEDQAIKMAKGKKGIFPLWLTPAQVRLIPVGQAHKKRCEDLLHSFSQKTVRAEYDDRDEPLGKKIRDAQKDWIPFIVVIGDRELESGKLSTTVRSQDGETKKEFTFDELSHLIEHEIQTTSKIFEKLSLPAELTKRPII